MAEPGSRTPASARTLGENTYRIAKEMRDAQA